MISPDYKLHGIGVRLALAADLWLSWGLPGERPYLALYRRYKLFTERHWLRWIARHRERFAGGDVVDVGANLGVLAESLLERLPADCRFHLFEPEPENFRRLERRMAAEGNRVRCVRAAVGERSGLTRLWVNPAHHFDHRLEAAGLAGWKGDRLDVPILALDDHFPAGLPRLALVKIDVQGHEPAVLRGMRRLLAGAPRALLRVEHSPPYLAAQGFDPESLTEELKLQGFSYWYRLGSGGTPAAEPPRTPDAEPSVDFLCSRFPLEN